MANEPKKLTIKEENVIYLNVEVNNTSIPKFTEQEEQDIIEKNEKFDREVLVPMMISRAQPCECRQQEILQRAMQRQRLLGGIQPGQPLQVELTQDDYDMYEFGVIVKSRDAVNEDCLLMTRRCKLCDKMAFWGNLRVLMPGFANMIDRHFVENGPDADKPDDEETEEDPQFIMENVDTGERIGSNNLQDLLNGGGKPVDEGASIVLSGDVEEKPSHKVIDLFDHA